MTLHKMTLHKFTAAVAVATLCVFAFANSARAALLAEGQSGQGDLVSGSAKND